MVKDGFQQKSHPSTPRADLTCKGELQNVPVALPVLRNHFGGCLLHCSAALAALLAESIWIKHQLPGMATAGTLVPVSPDAAWLGLTSMDSAAALVQRWEVENEPLGVG